MTLKGEANTNQSNKQGIYISQPDYIVNGETYWINRNGQFALWYSSESSGGIKRWIVGKIEDLGKINGSIGRRSIVSADDVVAPQEASTWTYFDGNIWKCQKGDVIVTGPRPNPNKKYLIGDWFSTAGFEVPAVLFITKYNDSANNATFCQRAKAKLVIYHVPKVKIFHYDVSNYQFGAATCSYACPPSPPRDKNCYNCGEIMPGGTYSTCLKDKVWTVNDLQEETSTQGYSPESMFGPPKPSIKDFLKPSQIQHVIDKSSHCQGTNII